MSPQPPIHIYLSTACLHKNHEYCRSYEGYAGLKTPAQCKFCQAPCVCDCHEAEPAGRPSVSALVDQEIWNDPEGQRAAIERLMAEWEAVHGRPVEGSLAAAWSKSETSFRTLVIVSGVPADRPNSA